MASGLLNSAGTDFDSLFERGQGNQLFYIYANDGTDIGQRYLPASSGTAASSCGFMDSSGSDVGPKLCRKGTAWTHKVTVGYGTTSLNDWFGYNKDNWRQFVGKGSIQYASGAMQLTACMSFGYEGYSMWLNLYKADGSRDGVRLETPPWRVRRLDTGAVYPDSGQLFSRSDVGKTIAVYIYQE